MLRTSCPSSITSRTSPRCLDYAGEMQRTDRNGPRGECPSGDGFRANETETQRVERDHRDEERDAMGNGQGESCRLVELERGTQRAGMAVGSVCMKKKIRAGNKIQLRDEEKAET